MKDNQDLPNGWQQATLGQVCEIIKRGVAPKYIDEGGICVINQKCIRDHFINLSLSRRHNIEIKSVPEERFIKIGDVLINSTGTGTLGRVAQVRKKPKELTTVDTHVTIARPKPGKFYLDFFGYMLIKIETEIADSGEGASGQTELSRKKVANFFKVTFPESIAEQRRIVEILDEAFKAIAIAEANTKKNLANAIELFDSYLNKVLRQHQQCSENKTLKEISLEFGRGKSKHRPRGDKKLYEGKYPLIQTGDVASADHYITEHSQTYNEIGLAQSKLWKKGTVCIAIVGANVAETGILNFDACFPDSVIGIVVDREKADSSYLEYILQSFKSELKEKGKGTARDNINMATFANQNFPFPDPKTQQRIARQIDRIADESKNLEKIYQRKLEALAELKQSILQKAFTGQLTSDKAEVMER